MESSGTTLTCGPSLIETLLCGMQQCVALRGPMMFVETILWNAVREKGFIISGSNLALQNLDLWLGGKYQ